MVKLETDGIMHEVKFYFKNMNDCVAFMHVFKDHWCNVPWKEPIEIPDDTNITKVQREMMNLDPRIRADKNLSWGFNALRKDCTDGRSGITEAQFKFIERIITQKQDLNLSKE